MYCYYCGEEVSKNQDVCLNCGKALTQSNRSTLSSLRDEGGFLWGLLGFLVPVAGLIIFLIWKNEYPLNAKAAGTGALVYVGLTLTFIVLYLVVFLSVFGFGFSGAF